jgi:hypothetical protein
MEESAKNTKTFCSVTSEDIADAAEPARREIYEQIRSRTAQDGPAMRAVSPFVMQSVTCQAAPGGKENSAVSRLRDWTIVRDGKVRDGDGQDLKKQQIQDVKFYW